MPTVKQTVAGNVDRLRIALEREDKNDINRAIASLEASLIESEGYKVVGDERLLAASYRILSQCYGDDLKPQLQGLSQHLDLMRLIHDKFFAILDPGIELDVLLFDSLFRWPLVDQPISCAFEDQDKDALHRARSKGSTEQRLENFLATYFQQLRTKGCEYVANLLQPSVDLALEGYKDMHTWTVQGLFTTPRWGDVYGLKISPEGNGEGTIREAGQILPQMRKAADHALIYVQGLRPQTKRWNFIWEIGRDDIAFEGNSIGLALAVGILAKVDVFDIDAYTAFTGHVHWETGQVTEIDEIDLKLQSARQLGIRRVFLPQENIKGVLSPEGIILFPVESVADAYQQLQSQSYIYARTDSERLAQARIRELEVELRTRGINRVDYRDESNHKRVTFSDYHEEVLVLVYHGQKGLRVVLQGKPGSSLLKSVQEVSDYVFGARAYSSAAPVKPAERPRETYKVRDPNTQERIKKYVFARGDVLSESEKNCAYRAKIVRGNQTVFVRQYLNGTIMVDGATPLYHEIDEGIRAILGVTGSSRDGGEGQNHNQEQIRAVEAIELGEKWVGSDEAGKGDYFGPLVSAAVLVDQQLAKSLEGLGVRDSKNLSDNRNRELAAEITKLCGKRAQIVTIPPSRYNALYNQFRQEGKNLNTLLAWAHTRALENILLAFPQEHLTVLVDKFADEKEVLGKLLTEARSANLRIMQLPKAEANVAVAAASILARAQFLRSMDEMSKQYRVNFPKGASDPHIPEIGMQIVARMSSNELAKVAKLHFKTTEKILAAKVTNP